MRIIGGRNAGLRLTPPSDLPVRPTTDMAKEALFNVLQNRIDFEGMKVLDLFSGTGSIAFEMASRGAVEVTAVDIHFKCVQYINAMAKKLQMEELKAVRADGLKFIKTAVGKYDFVFADPPFDLPQILQVPGRIFECGLLNPGAWLVLEHPSARKAEAHPTLMETRKYGYSSFSFYQYSATLPFST